jgi:hypothetical protein
MAGVARPACQEGFDNVKVKEGSEVVGVIDWAEVESIVASCNVGIEESKETEPEIEVTTAWLSVYSPVYDLAAPKWRFRFGKEIIYADISETNIAQQAMERGAVGVDDAYLVRLQITTEVDSQGRKKEPEYKILEVLRFVPAQPAARQGSLFDGDQH